jgi:hypothetical protein
MITAGSILQVFSMFMLSLTHRGQYYQVFPNTCFSWVDIYFLCQVFLAQAVGMGLGQSLLFLPSISVIGHHFKRRRAFATGIAVSVSKHWPFCFMVEIIYSFLGCIGGRDNMADHAQSTLGTNLFCQRDTRDWCRRRLLITSGQRHHKIRTIHEIADVPNDQP